MIVKNGICYPDDMAPVLKVVSCRAVGDSRLRVGFNNGEVREVDLSPLFSVPALAPLGNPEILDIAPEWLFDHGEPFVCPVVPVPPLSVAEEGAIYDKSEESAPPPSP